MPPRRWIAAGAVAVAAASAAAPLPAQPAGGEAPDWPCVQRKVATLTPATIWTGPAIETAGSDWAADAEVADLVARLAQRRLPLEEAEAEVSAFAASLPEGEREARLTRLFAGLFETMNRERGEIMEGIERFARRQRELAEEVRAEAARLGEARAAPGADPTTLAEAQAALDFRIRAYNERRASLTYACEVPRIVESRLFALGRAISGEIEGG